MTIFSSKTFLISRDLKNRENALLQISCSFHMIASLYRSPPQKFSVHKCRYTHEQALLCSLLYTTVGQQIKWERVTMVIQRNRTVTIVLVMCESRSGNFYKKKKLEQYLIICSRGVQRFWELKMVISNTYSQM